MDKREIIDDARRIGTYDISIEPHDDCCSYLMPPNPATHSTATDLERAEAPLDVNAEVQRLVANSVLVTVGEVQPDTRLPQPRQVAEGT
jgi:thiamine biosynthesis protein ThiI